MSLLTQLARAPLSAKFGLLIIVLGAAWTVARRTRTLAGRLAAREG